MMHEEENFKEPIFHYEETGTLKKNIAGILDAIIVVLLAGFITFLVMIQTTASKNFNLTNSWIYFFIVLILYRLIAILISNSTIGMMIMKIRYMRETTIKLSVKEKILAALMIYINEVGIYNIA